MICLYQHGGLCCNSGSKHYEVECRECECIVPITNADHIRSMTDEELAGFIADIARYNKEFVYWYRSTDWLKQPYKEDT